MEDISNFWYNKRKVATRNNKMSFTISSLAVAVLGYILEHAGVKIGGDQIGNFVNTAIQIIGAIGIYYGRFRQGGINIFGAKV